MFYSSLCVGEKRPHFITVRRLHGKCMVTVGSNAAVMLAAAGNYSDLSYFTDKREILGVGVACICIYIYMHISIYIYTYI